MSKILVLCPYVPHPPNHGGSIRSRVLLEALATDHEVHLAAAVVDERDRANLQALATELGITGHAIPARTGPRWRLLAKLRWLLGGSEALHRRWQRSSRPFVTRLIREQGFALTVLDSTFVLPVFKCMTPLVLLHLHNLEHAVFARAENQPRSFTDRWTRRFEARAVRSVEKSAIEFFSPTITVSDHDRQLALGLVPSAKVFTVQNSVDLERLPLQPMAPTGTPRLLFVGSLDYPPNLEAVTELVERHLPVLRASFPDLTVRLVGKDPRGVAARFRGIAGVETIGPVDDLLPHYRASHAAYLPIRSGGGTRIKILEAWALGLPVLSTAIGCEGLPARDGVALRCFETPEQGVAALREVLAGQINTLRANGRRLVEERFSHAAARAQFRAITNEMLAKL
jgi:glycosyltransferase involved in cell wall biosynthesis